MDPRTDELMETFPWDYPDSEQENRWFGESSYEGEFRWSIYGGWIN